jgi:hypothetical protein
MNKALQGYIKLSTRYKSQKDNKMMHNRFDIHINNTFYLLNKLLNNPLNVAARHTIPFN